MKDASKVDHMLYAGSNLDKARKIFAAAIKHRPRIRLTIRQGRGCWSSGNEKPRPLGEPRLNSRYFAGCAGRWGDSLERP